MLDHLYPLNLSRYHDQSTQIQDHNGNLLHVSLSKDQQWRLPAQQLPAHYLDLLIHYEDRYFYQHPGINPIAIIRAAIQNAASGRTVSGASTLTMQTARLLEPHPERSLKAKIREALRALQLEWHFSKAEILDIYATLAPMGGNHEGVNAAAWHYFNKPAYNLSLGETAWLVVLPQSPNRYIRPEYAINARNKVLNRAESAGIINSVEANHARKQPLNIGDYSLPRHASHYVRTLDKSSHHITTSIDGQLQRDAEKLFQHAAQQLPEPATLAAAIIDNSSSEYLLYIGSAMPYSQSRLGYVDMLQAIRSPGSTLKPFIYLFAFDWLNYHPLSSIADTPISQQSYRPSNYDGLFLGNITMQQALSRSRNVPAVRLLAEIEADYFATALCKHGLTLHFPNNATANLSLALGGVGIRATELLQLYRQLANCTFQPSSTLAEQTACTNVTRILQQSANLNYDGEAMAVKTGTAYGWRDRWVMAYSRDYTLLLWAGRADGGYSEQRSSAEALLPLAQQLINLLPPHDTPITRLPPLKRHIAAQRISLQSQHNPIETQAFTVTTPLNNSQIDWQQNRALQLSVKGGQPPYLWLINDQYLTSSNTNHISYQADSSGHYHLSVIDQNGQTANSYFVLQQAQSDSKPTVTLQRTE
ncbi:penicillin-binding protein 1C [Cardiobacteriaceae bacterium TAE3-ERU3]|nr:penicillin-binding protein 1C [Cardiobacteriaceae bacterium TAE3-ERU3]